MIPKVTHQIWFQGWKNLPDKYAGHEEKLSFLNQNWEHMKWDEESLRSECATFSQDALEKFDSLSEMIQKVDFGRYVVLYNHGGVSVDCDAECLRPLDRIPGLDRYDFIIGRNPLNRLENKVSSFGLSKDLVIVNNATLCCSKENAFMKSFIEFLIKNESWNEDPMLDTHLKTGPLIVSIFINKHLDNPDINIVDSDVFEPWGNVTRRTILNHTYDQSWTHFGPYPAKMYRILKNNLAVLLVLIVVAFLFVFIRRFVSYKYKQVL
jgi:mannosyltransferase OCH1-like enzyme